LKIDRVWRELPEDEKENIRDYLRRAALIALAVEQLLPQQSAKVLIDAFGVQITLAVTAKILEST